MPDAAGETRIPPGARLSFDGRQPTSDGRGPEVGRRLSEVGRTKDARQFAKTSDPRRAAAAPVTRKVDGDLWKRQEKVENILWIIMTNYFSVGLALIR